MPALESKLNPRSADFQANADAMRALVADLHQRLSEVEQGGGENIYPREVEEFLYRHPMVQDVQVVGVPDPKYGEELCAWIIVKPGQALTDDEVREFCKGRIAHYKVPRYIRFVGEFPMTVTGKIQKFKIREAMVALLALDAEKTA